MSNYPEQYFNQDADAKNVTNQNKTVVKEVEVSGSSTDKIYVAQLVKLAGEGVNVSIGSIAVDLDHANDSVKIGDGTDLWGINTDGSGKISGSTILYDSGGTRSANVLTNNALKISGTTQIGDGTNNVTVFSNNSLRISGSTQISDGNNTVDIISGHLKVSGVTTLSNVDVVSGSLKVSGATSLYNSGGTTSANILSNNALKISGTTQIGDGTNVVNVLSNNALKISGTTQIGDGTNLVDIISNHLKISGLTTLSNVDVVSSHLKTSGITSIQNVNVSGNSLQTIITSNESHIGQIGGHSKKPQIKITRLSGPTPTYSILDIINSGGTVMERFRVARSNNKNSYVFAGHMTSSVSASTSLNCDLHLFSSGLTISADNALWQPNVNELDHHLGYINFSTWKVLGNRSVSEGVIENPFLLITDPDNPDSVWGALIARNAYVASDSEVLTVSLDVSQD